MELYPYFPICFHGVSRKNLTVILSGLSYVRCQLRLTSYCTLSAAANQIFMTNKSHHHIVIIIIIIITSSRRYSPGWALAFSTISLHFSISFIFPIHCFIFITFRSATTSPIYLKRGLPFLLPINEVFLFFFLQTVFLPSSFLASLPLPFSLHVPTILLFELL